MSVACFLLDEHIPNAVIRGLRRRESAIQIFRIGGFQAPTIGTSDVDLLKWIEAHLYSTLWLGWYRNFFI